MQSTENRSAFIAYWRGEVPLGRSFWLGFMLVGIPAGLVITRLYQWLVLHEDEGADLILPVGLLTLLLLALKGWAIIGTWRAAGAQVGYGPGFWPRTAQVCMALAALNVVSVAGLRLFTVGYAVHQGRPVAVAGAVVRANGTRIDFNGPITVGSSAQLAAALASAPAAHRIRLESPGGLVTESRHMAQLIKTRGADTEVLGVCASACTITFFSGQSRTIADTGKLGFHSYSSPNSTPQDLLKVEAVESRAYADAGVPRWFIDRMFSIPPAKIWYPTRQDLVAAGFVTDNAPPPEPASGDMPIASADQAASGLSPSGLSPSGLSTGSATVPDRPIAVPASSGPQAARSPADLPVPRPVPARTTRHRLAPGHG